MIEIYSKAGCNLCDMAKEFLDDRCIIWTEIKLEKESDIEAMKQKTGSRTFPFIFDDGQYIGGTKELMIVYDF